MLSWLNDLGPPSGPAALVTAAWMAALTGDETALARHLEALDGLEELGPLPDGSQSVSSSIAQMRGLLGYGGPADMLTAARLAVALETNPRSPQYAIAHLAFGHALYVHGDLDGAAVSLQAATHSRPAPGIIRIMSQSLLSFAEHERGNLIEAREHAEQAMDILNRQIATGRTAGPAGVRRPRPSPGSGRQNRRSGQHPRARTRRPTNHQRPRRVGADHYHLL